MARQRMATAAGCGGAASRSELDGMSRAEVIAECLVLRDRCAEKDSAIRELRGQLRDSNARADAAKAENGRLERRYAWLEKKANGLEGDLEESNGKNAELAGEMKAMIARFKEVTGNLAAMKKAERHYRAKAIGAKPNTKKATKDKKAKEKKAKGGQKGGRENQAEARGEEGRRQGRRKQHTGRG